MTRYRKTGGILKEHSQGEWVPYAQVELLKDACGRALLDLEDIIEELENMQLRQSKNEDKRVIAKDLARRSFRNLLISLLNEAK
jgi:hypothetical protein